MSLQVHHNQPILRSLAQTLLILRNGKDEQKLCFRKAGLDAINIENACKEINSMTTIKRKLNRREFLKTTNEAPDGALFQSLNRTDTGFIVKITQKNGCSWKDTGLGIIIDLEHCMLFARNGEPLARTI